MRDILGAFTGNSLPSIMEISSGTESQKNAEKMTKGWMAGELGQDPAFAVHLLIVMGGSLYPLQFLVNVARCLGFGPCIESFLL